MAIRTEPPNVTAPLLLAALLLDILLVKMAAGGLAPALKEIIRPVDWPVWGEIALFAALFFVYLAICEVVLTGRTFGRLTLNLHAQSTTPRPIGFGRMFVRFLHKCVTLGLTSLNPSRAAPYDERAGLVWASDLGPAQTERMPSGPAPDPGRGARGGRGGRRGPKAPIRKWRLRVASGPDQKRYLIVGQTSGFRESKTVRIGREKGWADLRLTPPFVSSRHCFIRFIGDQAEIFDYGTDGAGSTNGTTIHGRRVPPGGSAPIGDATHFFVGKIRIDILN